MPHTETTPLHHTNGGFRNPYIEEPQHSFKDIIQWRFGDHDDPGIERYRDSIPVTPVDLNKLHHPGEKPQITWLGHATVLVQYAGKNVITDPILTDRASPVSFIGPQRMTPAALSLEELPPIDLVVISHNHYDHLDRPTVRAIGNRATWIVPLNMKSWFLKQGITNVVELDWWESHQVSDVKIFSTPSQHWTKRGLNDDHTILWSSWLIEFSDFKVWFAGDTGYNDVQFKAIGNRYGPIDAAFIPIGAYNPRWFMKFYHVNPEEAVQIHQDVQARWSLGIHWGTFIQTDEPIIEPPQRLQTAVKQQGLAPNAFETLPIGGIKILTPVAVPTNL